MQTFLPYESFIRSAQCLDMRRLGKQRVEAYQLLLLMGKPEQKGWRNHPAFKMWEGFDLALAQYGMDMCQEWVRRGYKDTLHPKFLEYYIEYGVNSYRGNKNYPLWLGDYRFHSSHRSSLLYKDYDWYSEFGWTEKPAVPIKVTKQGVTLPYYWPVKQEE